MRTLETAHHENKKISKLPLALLNFEYLDSGDCTGMLQRLETLEKIGVEKKDLQIYLDRIDSQLNYTLLF